MIKRVFDWSRKYFRWDIYARLTPYLRPYWRSIILVIAVLLAQVGLGLLEPWCLQVLVDNGLLHRPLPDWLAQTVPFLDPEDSAAIVLLAVAAGVLVYLCGRVCEIAGDYLKARVNAGVNVAFQADLFNHLQRLSLAYHDQTTVGDSLYRLNNDSAFLSTLLWGNFRHLLRSTFTLVGMVWVIVWIDWQIAVLALGVAPLLYAAVALSGRYFRARSRQVKGLESNAQSVLHEVLSCLRVVKAFGQEERERQRFAGTSWSAQWARLRLSLEQAFFSAGLGMMTRLSHAVILLVGGFHVLSGHMEVGVLLVVLTYVRQIHEPLQTIGETFTDMQLSLASAERVLEVLDIEPEVRDRPGARTLTRVAGAITFAEVGFAYRPGQPVLHAISFTARPGEVVAIVGPTGAGKTTLANLIARFYDPQSGRVALDGHDLRDLTVRTLRDNLALVIQEPILFSTTIRDNIAYGRPDAGFEQIVSAAQAANAHDFIMALPQGYDSQVGERGVRLSGGERQRIAVARAFLKDAPVLILDEPTSSVDSRTELGIIDALDRLMEGRTTFIIAHRLSTIRRADHILVLEHGHIIEAGTHDELLARGGLYAHFHRIQSAGLRRGKEEVPA